MSNGFVARIHGNKGKMPKNACEVADVKTVVDFIKNYADVHAVPLPGRLPKHQDYCVMKLPSDVTKSSVYHAYSEGLQALHQSGEHARSVSHHQFCRLWQQLVPFVTTMKPSTDLCMICQENVAAIMKSSNQSEDENSNKLKAAELHLKHAKEERAEYNRKEEVSKKNWVEVVPYACQIECETSSTVSTEMLYSFDHAQLVHIPWNPQEPGPTYFKTAQKCENFGICCEGRLVQKIYLIDEAESIGKGANSIISYLHYLLETHGIGETNL